MFEKILLPLDGSELAETALAYAIEIGGRLGSEVTLFHVCPVEHRQYQHMHKLYLERLAEAVESKVREGQPEGRALKITTQIEAGEPHESICNLVEKNDIGLIIMTTAGTSGQRISILGSVADHVCRTVPVPVILIRPQDAQRIQGRKRLIERILLPLDGSDLSKLALPVAEELAARLKAEIALFQMAHMVIPYTDDAASAAFVDYSKLSEAEERRVRAEMIALEKKLREKGLTVTQSVTLGLNAADEIIELEKKVGADLVVMSTHGRSGLGRWVMGSIAEKVLHHGEVPLLLVNARSHLVS